MLEKLKEQIVRQQEQEKQNESAGNEDTLPQQDDQPVNEDLFIQVLGNYISTLERTGKSRISAFLKESPTTFIPPHTLEIELKSQMEELMMEEERMDFMPLFRGTLKNSKADIVFKINTERIQQSGKVSKPDQLKRLIEKNPVVGDFVQGLGLEIDY